MRDESVVSVIVSHNGKAIVCGWR